MFCRLRILQLSILLLFQEFFLSIVFEPQLIFHLFRKMRVSLIPLRKFVLLLIFEMFRMLSFITRLVPRTCPYMSNPTSYDSPMLLSVLLLISFFSFAPLEKHTLLVVAIVLYFMLLISFILLGCFLIVFCICLDQFCIYLLGLFGQVFKQWLVLANLQIMTFCLLYLINNYINFINHP